MQIQYLPDSEVTDIIDQKLRLLLSASFLNNQDSEHFARQRYYKEMPQHRYMAWEGDELAAHIAVHEKQVSIDGIEHSIAGIAEVCVNEAFRGQGLVKQLLKEVHQHRLAAEDDFALLFGEAEIYSSSGYQTTTNVLVHHPDNGWVLAGKTMAKALNNTWPSGEVKLIGLPF
ncbi:GNAT family N-acetyltransferase [Grimontia sp. NTOU-MAR1]|uniref:GNAT family N-acetyltransferase n=1 Tax=Grimontia sp. NTOU-MAR1 TaxID=3111011 RepID=UPI002DB69051|nr:GNAT family N-acetyltransferase [Grimontia sp. NTOU-MAR1]WRW00330.1 GNAT family N-acetyltransferase [Grimontia sp. NTOU-MAR1]